MRNKITFFAIFALVATILLGSIPNQAAASPEDDTLLRISSQAHEELRIQISRADNVTAEIEQLFQQGTDELAALKEAIRNEDTSAKREYFLATMHTFKKITSMISDLSSAESTTAAASVIPDYQSTLERMEKYILNLKTIAERHGADIDFTEINGLFDSTNQQIQKEQHDETKESIDQIKRKIGEINQMLREKAQQKIADRARIYAQQYVERIDKTIAEAEELEYSVEIIDKLKEAKGKLSESSEPNQIIIEIKKILSIKEQLDLSKFDRIISRVNQIEEKLDAFSTTDSDPSIIEEARALMLELRTYADEQNYDDAQSTLRVLMSMLKQLEN